MTLVRRSGRWIVATLLLSLAGTAEAATVTGVVKDPAGRPVASARVSVLGPLGVLVVQTDAAGRYYAAGLAAGTYQVTVDAPGLHGATEPMELAADDARTIDLSLDLNPLSASVVVSAAQVETPLDQVAGSIFLIRADDLSERQVESFGDALRIVPGFTVSRSGGRGALTSVFPRGGESDYTLVLVDGVRVNAFGGGLDFSLVDLGGVERIEVMRGPQSALYGADAIGGVVQVITAQGGRSRGDGLVEGGHERTWRATLGGAGSVGALTWGGGAERGGSDGYRGIAPASGEMVTNDDGWHAQVSGTAAWHSSGGTTIRGVARWYENDRGFPGPYGSDPIDAFPGVDRISRGRNDDRVFGLSAVIPLRSDGRVRLRFSSDYGDLRSDYESPFGPSTFDTRRISGRGQGDIALTPATSLTAGVEALNERARSTYITGAQFEPVPIERYDIGYFGELRQQIGSRLALTAGLRLEQLHRDALEPDPNPYAPRPPFPAESQLSANPRVGVVYSAHRDASGSVITRVHASAGTGIRPPDAYEIAYTDNPELRPERSRSVEAGVSHTLRTLRTDVEVTAFRNNYDDLIVAVSGEWPDASRFRTDNISNARAQGVEVGAAWRSAWGLSARASYTFLDTAILAVDRAGAAPPPFTVGDPLVRRPRHQASLDVVFARGAMTGFLDVGARASTLDIEPNYGAFGGLFTNPGFTVVNAGAAVRLHRTIEIFGRAMNLFDRAYEEALGYPALPRGGMIGIRLAVGQ
jgi:outer membrane cobalamin receptor